MLNYYYRSTLEEFHTKGVEEIIGKITIENKFDSTVNQNQSWHQQIVILQEALAGKRGTIFFEFSVPRIGSRVDCVLLIGNTIFVVEFKVGEDKYLRRDIEQVWDYALDLKNFHRPSHDPFMVPILVATEAPHSVISIITTHAHQDKLVEPLQVNAAALKQALNTCLMYGHEGELVNPDTFAQGSYSPTPTIIEAAVALYNNHSVHEITRSDAAATNLTKTTTAISNLITHAKLERLKIICFVTGVPGAGKTLVGLDVATSHLDKSKGDSTVYLSGNAPLVAVLQEALVRDRVRREQVRGTKVTKSVAKEGVKAFIQLIHHYRDTYLVDTKAPYDHVAIFDEAQRAWNKEQTVKFMTQKKGQKNFDFSEPEFLISCLNRHEDWAVVVCLVGGGQEINTGEGGIAEWLYAIDNRFSHWKVWISPNLKDSEYSAGGAIEALGKKSLINFSPNLHLDTCMRSFRSEDLSRFVKNLLDMDEKNAKQLLSRINIKYPIRLTRDLGAAKAWLKDKARGTERYGLVVSSQAQRLKPLAIDVKSPINPVNYFLNDKDDIRSSYFMEDAATEFQVQGLELDWSCIIWDGDLQYTSKGWSTYSFKGKKWQKIKKDQRKRYLINAYRVLLTRARQGMVIVVPEGSTVDHTRKPEFYEGTYSYLFNLGIELL